MRKVSLTVAQRAWTRFKRIKKNIMDKKDPKKYCSVRMSLDLFTRITALAGKEQRSFTGQVLFLLEKALAAK